MNYTRKEVSGSLPERAREDAEDGCYKQKKKRLCKIDKQ